MEQALFDILAALETKERLDERELTKIINRHNKRILDNKKAAGQGTRAAERETASFRAEEYRDAATAKSTHAAVASPRSAGDDKASGKKQGSSAKARPLSKRQLMAFYLDVQKNQPERWARWNLSSEQQRRLVRTLQMKPRRTASGVATITVLTKPWKCSSNCLYCPNDLRMPKSYLADEPACQRAERTFFDPYLQVAARLKALTEMGHVTDKVELIVLGGTWSDYPPAYQIWFIRELFRALNDGAQAWENVPARKNAYENAGIASSPEELKRFVAEEQRLVDARKATYNQAFDRLYATSAAWNSVAQWQQATWEELEAEHATNVDAQHRVVGLVIETRPERITPAHLAALRRMGCTKVQMGIQSLDAQVRKANERHTSTQQIQRAFELLRLFGFKTHVHAMVNLLGATPESDKADYLRLCRDTAFQPDEVKLYPCVLVEGTGLCKRYEDGAWQPYPEQELVDVLVADTCATPPFTRISRMIRDISAPDIKAGNKKVNLRQLVEQRIDAEGLATAEIRHREVSLANVAAESLSLQVVPYETTATSERFLQWVTPEGRIAGFLRLSLPHPDAMAQLEREYAEAENAMPPSTKGKGAVRASAGGTAPASSKTERMPFPLHANEAMIREVHVYGRVEKLQRTGVNSAQHRGLGTQLVNRACELAAQAGYARINVISAVGTRGYYRKLGFYDNGLYQQRTL